MIMNKTESYTELSSQIMRNFRRGMLTNHFAAKDRLTRDIEKGLVYTAESENGLLIITDRGTHYYLHFYLHSPALVDEIPDTGSPIVLEITKKNGDTSFGEAESSLNNRGFEHTFRRLRYSLSPSANTAPVNDRIRYASYDDLGNVMNLLHESFSPLTGCIPSEAELLTDTEHILMITDSNKPSALLHYREERKSIEIRHLCTDANHRGQGLGSILVGEVARIAGKESKKLTVWVREDYVPAQSVYKKYGFTPDGMISDVYIRHA